MLSITSQQLDLWLGTGVWPFCRILALFSVAPIYHHRSIPAQVKIALSIAMTMLVVSLYEGQAVPLSSPQAPAILAQQLLIGIAIGFSMRLVFAAVELAGDLIGLQMGLSFASFIDPQNSTPTPILGGLLGIFASLLFLSINGHLLMVEAIMDSFREFPIGALGSGSASPVDAARLVAWTGEVFRVGLHLALPVLATLLILNIALGVLARAAPQLSVFSVGFPITLITGLLALTLALPHILPYLQSALERATHL